jgi:flagellar hook-length control protein FliK
MSVSQGGVEVRLRLHPESLGDVQVEVRWKGGQLTARLEAATATARDALEAGLPALRTALREQGVEVDHLQVGLRLDLEGQHSHHELSRQPGAPPDSTFLPGAPGWTEEPAVSAPLSAPVSLARLDLRI